MIHSFIIITFRLFSFNFCNFYQNGDRIITSLQALIWVRKKKILLFFNLEKYASHLCRKTTIENTLFSARTKKIFYSSFIKQRFLIKIDSNCNRFRLQKFLITADLLTIKFDFKFDCNLKYHTTLFEKTSFSIKTRLKKMYSLYWYKRLPLYLKIKNHNI